MSDERLDPPEAELQQWIDDLLMSPIAAPAALRGEIQGSIRRKQRRVRTIRILTAAATILFVFLSLQKTPVSVDRPVVSRPNTIAPASTDPIAAPETPQKSPSATAPIATFVARSDLIAIPLESNDPTVTIIQIYPTTITHRRWQREAALQAALTSPPQIPTTPFRGG